MLRTRYYTVPVMGIVTRGIVLHSVTLTLKYHTVTVMGVVIRGVVLYHVGYPVTTTRFVFSAAGAFTAAWLRWACSMCSDVLTLSLTSRSTGT